MRIRDSEGLIELVEAFKDSTVWAITLISFTNALPTGGLGAFSNIIINAFVSSSLFLPHGY